MFDPRFKKRPARPLTEPMAPERLRELFPDARLLCECPSGRDVCPATCDRFEGKRQAMRDWFASAEVVSK